MSWLDGYRAAYGADSEGLARAVAAALFDANDRSRGIFRAGGFHYITSDKQGAWLRRAHRLLSLSRGTA